MPFLDRYIFQLEPKPLPYREVIYIKNNETEKPAKPALNSGKSMLRYLGYDVSAKKSLCAFDRKTILKRIVAIEYLMNKSDVIAYIESNINRYQHNPKMRRAVIRWQEDLECIQKTLRSYIIEGIKYCERRKSHRYTTEKIVLNQYKAILQGYASTIIATKRNKPILETFEDSKARCNRIFTNRYDLIN